MKKLLIRFFVASLFHSLAWASPPKMGKTVCLMGDCEFSDVPTGTILEKTENQDLRELDIVQPAAPSPKPKITGVPKKVIARKAVKPKAVRADSQPSNLPGYYQGLDLSDIEASEQSVYNPKAAPVKFKGLRAGDVVRAVIEQAIKASPSVPTPIRATAISGSHKGAIFLGEATLDRELKRVLIVFTKLRLKRHKATYTLKASGLSTAGSIGLEGNYVSNSGKFLIAELGAAAAAGFVDASVQRTQTTQGGYVQEPSVGNAAKAAAGQALLQATNRSAEQVRSAPEYTEVSGYQEIQIIIQEDPIESET